MEARLTKKQDNRAAACDEVLLLGANFLLCVPDDNSAVHATRYEALAAFVDDK